MALLVQEGFDLNKLREVFKKPKYFKEDVKNYLNKHSKGFEDIFF